ncbi:MAG: deoxycytidylate deaminase [Limnochordia bacterium]
MQERPTWDEYFMQIAELVSSRSTCLRRQVGAILVKDRRIIATGYNGAPTRVSHCAEVGCLRQQLAIPSGERHEICRGIHAEQNGIIQAALHGVSTQGAVLYCTTQPCVQCAKMLINAGVERIVFRGGYPDPLARELLCEAGIVVEQWKENQEG